MSPLEKIKKNIADAINSALDTKAVKAADLVYPPNPQFGDLSLPCYQLAKQFGKSAVELAELLISKVKLNDVVIGTKAIGPFINFTFNKTVLAEITLTEIGKSGANYGQNKAGRGKRVMVEFAHPNTHKAFHIGHLRNILTGETIAKILAANGYEVIRANYQGDIGLHIAKCLWGIGQLKAEYEIAKKKGVKEKAEFLGQAYALGSQNYEEQAAAKGEITELNKKIYNQDKNIRPLYLTTRKWSLDYFNQIYKRVGTKFDRLYFESEVFNNGREIVLKNLARQVFKTSEGAVIFEGEKYGLHTRVFINSEGNPTYEAKDMGLAELQFKEYQPERIIHVVGPEQAEYFKVIIKALEIIMPETKGREKHLPYGWVKLREGKMSSRLGNVVLGEWLLDEAKKEILAIMKTKRNFKDKEAVAEKISLAAVKYSILKSGINTDIAFSLEESISFSGMSGPYLQYTGARINSILRKSQNQNPKSQINSKFKTQNIKLDDPREQQIIMKLAKYPEVVATAGNNFDPSEIAKYLFELAQEFNDYYHAVPVLKAKTEIKQARLVLINAVKQVLANGLELLGIEAVEEM